MEKKLARSDELTKKGTIFNQEQENFQKHKRKVISKTKKQKKSSFSSGFKKAINSHRKQGLALVVAALFMVSLFSLIFPSEGAVDVWTYTKEGNAGADDEIYDAMQERNPGEVYKFYPNPEYIVSGIPVGDYQELQIDFQTANLGTEEDIYLQVWDYTAGEWNTRDTIDSVSLTPLEYNLTSDEISSGVCNIRFVDSDQTYDDHLQSTLGIDYVRVYTYRAGSSTGDDYVDEIYNIDEYEEGIHSNFTTLQFYDSIYDNLTEAGGSVSLPIEDYIDSQSNVDSSADNGTHSNFDKMKNYDSIYDTLTESNETAAVIVRDGVNQDENYSSSVTFNHVLGYGSGNNRLVVVAAGFEHNAGDIEISNATYNGQLMIKIVQATVGGTGYSTSVAIFYILDTNLPPDTGSYPVIVKCASAPYSGRALWACAVSYINVNQSAPDSYYSDSSSSPTTNMTCDMTCAADGSMLVQACVVGRDGSFPLFSPEPGTTEVTEDYNIGSASAVFNEKLDQISGARNLGCTHSDMNRGSWVGACWAPVTIELPDYKLDIEVQFDGVIHFLQTETLCIYAGAFTSAENITVEYWNVSTEEWTFLVNLTANDWNNISVYLTSEMFTIRFIDGIPSSDASQDSWQIDAVLLRVSEQGSNEDAVDNETSNVDGSNDIGILNSFNSMKTKDGMATLTEQWVGWPYNAYRLDQEVQWTNVGYQVPYKQLCIYAGTLSGEDIRVEYWNGTNWITVFSDLNSNSWNNVTISSYVDSITFTIRFVDGTQTSDDTQSSWNIDVALIYLWQEANVPFDIDLEIRWTGVDISESYYNLSIYCGTFNTTEDLQVWIWDWNLWGWDLIASSLTENSWNNFTISSYISLPNVIIRFLGASLQDDLECSDWEIDVSIIFGWTPELNEYDYTTTEGNADADDDFYDVFNESGTGTVPTELHTPYTTLTRETGEVATFEVTFRDTYHDINLTGANVLYEWNNGSGQFIYDANEVGNGVYNFTIDTVSLDEGTYNINVTATKENYDTQSLQLSLVIVEPGDGGGDGGISTTVFIGLAAAVGGAVAAFFLLHGRTSVSPAVRAINKNIDQLEKGQTPSQRPISTREEKVSSIIDERFKLLDEI